MQFISYVLTRTFVQLFGLLPFSAIYRVADFAGWLFFKFGYREKVVYGNLRRCFPEKSETEIREIARKSYQNLADITLESIKGSTTPLAELDRRYKYKNPEIVNRHLAAGRSVMLTGGHFANWEWAVLTAAQNFKGNVIGVYKSLTNKYLDKYFYKTRARGVNMTLKNMKETFGAVEQYKNDPTVFILVSDQSPSNRKTSQWVRFFNTETACLPGVDIIPRENNMPVVFFHVERTARGFYEMSFSEIENEPAKTAAGEINQKLATKLEEKIRENPSPWLWSHRRWKMEKQEN